jgi:hypothetical protein
MLISTAIFGCSVTAKIVCLFYRFEYTIPALTIGEGVSRVSAVIACDSICPPIPFGVFALLAARNRHSVYDWQTV